MAKIEDALVVVVDEAVVATLVHSDLETGCLVELDGFVHVTDRKDRRGIDCARLLAKPPDARPTHRHLRLAL